MDFKIPSFLKKKRFLIFAFFFILVLILIQAGLFQADKSIEKILNNRIQNGIKQFEKQTGLQISWQQLNFNLFKLTLYLEGVEVLPLQTVYTKNIQELIFLNGLQKIEKISARPALTSLLFKKEIFLSKVNIGEGELSFSYSKPLKKIQRRNQKDLRLPIKKIHVKNTDIAFQYKNYTLNFFGMTAHTLQKKNHIFQFDFFVPSFFIDDERALNHLSQHFSKGLKKSNRYELSVKGVVKPNDLAISSLSVKNDFFQSLTESLQIRFDNQKLSFFEIASSGSFPLILIQQIADMAGKSLNFSESYLSYNMKLSYDKKRKWQGLYQLSAENIFFRSAELKKITAEGALNGSFLFVNRGELVTKNKGSFTVQKIQWRFLNPQQPYELVVQSRALSSEFITRYLLNAPKFPLSGDLTGWISCKGFNQAESIQCSFKGKSRQILLQPHSKDEIFSVYDFDWDLSLGVENKILNFKLKGEKEKARLNLEGEYSFLLEELRANYFFNGDVKEDLRFNLPFDIKGRVIARRGSLWIKNGKTSVSGELLFSLLNLNQYSLNRLSSFYKFSDNQLVFSSAKGLLGSSRYLAKAEVDFSKKNLNLELESGFFSLKDFSQAIKQKQPLPFELKGTGALSAVINYPWEQPENKNFFLSGSFFNIFVDKDFFKQSDFQFDLKNQKGQAEFFMEKENQALLKGKGRFNHNYQCDIDLNITNIPLESIQFANFLFPFNQVGDVNAQLKMTGFLNDPQIKGDVSISNTFLYSYSVKDTALKLSLNKKALSFSGRIMDQIQLEEFSYWFSKKPKTRIKGNFENLDLSAFLLSKNRKDKVENYRTKIKGFIDLEKEEAWKGVVKMEDFVITKSNKELKSLSPFFLYLDKKAWSLSAVNFLDNDKQLFQIKEEKNKKLTLRGVFSLDFLSLLFPFFKELEGRLEGELLVNNNLRQLNPKGSLNLKNGLFVIPDLPDFTNVSARLEVSNNKFSIKNFKSLAGGGQLRGSGKVIYDFVKAPDLDLNLDFEKVFLQFPEGFNTNGKGNIKITGSQTPYLINGWYHIQGGSIVKEFSSSDHSADYDFTLIKEEDTKTSSIFSLKLNLKTDNPVNVNNSLIQSSIEGEAYIYGLLHSALMTGKFQLSKSLKKNLIFFRGQEFEVKTGSIVFSNSSPKKPYLDVSASTLFKERVIDPLESEEEIEKEYDIFLFAKGPADDLKFSLRSYPVLNEKEIISLLTLGVNSQHFDSNVNEDITGYSYQILTSLLIEKPLNREIKETLGLDFRLTPYINTLNKPVTKLTLSRTWFERWKTSFSRTLEESAQSDVRFKYDVSPKMSLTAFWENRGDVELEEFENDWLGFDLEFQFDF